MSRVNHKWGLPDDYGIYECDLCGCLMKKKANVTYTLISKSAKKWIVLYSKKGVKWTTDRILCQN
jgi:hypothetical protein